MIVCDFIDFVFYKWEILMTRKSIHLLTQQLDRTISSHHRATCPTLHISDELHGTVSWTKALPLAFRLIQTYLTNNTELRYLLDCASSAFSVRSWSIKFSFTVILDVAHSTVDPSRVTFTAILDVAHSTLDPSRVTFTVVLDVAHSTLDPSRVTLSAILDLAHSTLDPSRVTFTVILDVAHSTLLTHQGLHSLPF
jgi:Fe-S-cluster formation regulator IscX/YfhJ